MELEFWATTDVGRVRDHNEDNFLVDKRMKLFVVCDGMGGHAAGEIASAMSVRVVREVMSSHREVFDRLSKDPDNLANRKSMLNLVEHSIHEACLRVYQAAQEDQTRKGMGTTCSLLLLAQGRGFIGHVGDSRIYLYRQGQVHQITEDHSLINEMIRLGKLKKGEEHNLPHKNAVTRAVGVNEFVEVDTFELDVFGGDAFLLCSDGLSGYFKDEAQISNLLDKDDVREVTEEAIDFANAGGGKDNITAIAVRVTSEDIHTRDIQRTMEVMRSTPFFQYLAYKEMVQMVNLSKRSEYALGDVVFEEGSDPGSMFLVVRGQVRLMREGRELGKLYPGDYFGETALIDETPLAYSVTAAAAETVLLSFRRERFMGLLRGEPNLAVKLLWNFVQTFTARLRPIPYETFLGDRVQELEEPTPPSGTLVFEEDQNPEPAGHQPSSVSGEFVPPELSSGSNGVADDATPPSTPAPDAKNGETLLPDYQDPNKTLPPGAARQRKTPVSDTTPMKKGSRRAASSSDLDATLTNGSSAPDLDVTLANPSSAPAPDATRVDPDSTMTGDDMAWEDIVPQSLLDESSADEEEDLASLRETMQMDRDELESDERERRLGGRSSGAQQQESDADADEPTDGPSTPKAQVLKRTKLVVGDERRFDSSERTSDVKPLRERLRDRSEQKTTNDSTIEVDPDDNVEERS